MTRLRPSQGTRVRVGAWLVAGLITTTAAGCSAAVNSHNGVNQSGSALGRVKLQPGFCAPGKVNAQAEPVELNAIPATHIDIPALKRPDLNGPTVTATAQAIVHQPLTTEVRPLLTSTATLAPGETFTAVAGDLAPTPHTVTFVLAGPCYRAERLVQVTDGIAAMNLTLPTGLAAGSWGLGAEDVSGITTGQSGQVGGRVLLDLVVFRVPD
jgi:hypothetical protein